MNHYPHHIGDYLKDTAHLDPLEDGIYRRMIDLYYTQEGALPNDIKSLCRRLRLDQGKHGEVLISLLNEFFILSEESDDWHHSRCDREIKTYQSKADANRQNGKLGGRPKKPTDIPEITQVVSVVETQKNLNQNQNQNQVIRASRKTSLPKDFSISERVKQWAQEKGHHSLQAHFENFVGAARAKGYTYVDWDEALMKAIRDNWAKVPAKQQRQVAM